MLEPKQFEKLTADLKDLAERLTEDAKSGALIGAKRPPDEILHDAARRIKNRLIAELHRDEGYLASSVRLNRAPNGDYEIVIGNAKAWYSRFEEKRHGVIQSILNTEVPAMLHDLNLPPGSPLVGISGLPVGYRVPASAGFRVSNRDPAKTKARNRRKSARSRGRKASR